MKRMRPYIAALLAVVFGPWLGCFYLGRGRLGLVYLTLIIVLALSATVKSAQIVLALWLIGAVHCFYLARREEETTRRPWYSRGYALAGFAALGVLSALVIDLHYMPASSMSPTINVGDRVFASPLAYAFGARPERGDVATFHHDSSVWIKRIVGLPGDTVQYKGGELYLNGEKQRRTRIEDFVMEAWDNEVYPRYVETLNGGRSYGILEAKNDARYDNTPVYTVPEAMYLVLGDNRDESIDSRLERLGFVPEERLIGRALYAYGGFGFRSLE